MDGRLRFRTAQPVQQENVIANQRRMGVGHHVRPELPFPDGGLQQRQEGLPGHIAGDIQVHPIIDVEGHQQRERHLDQRHCGQQERELVPGGRRTAHAAFPLQE